MSPRNFFKKGILVSGCILTLSTGVIAAPPSVTDKVQKTFNQTFPDAQQVCWLESTDKFTVSFKQNEILTKIDYDKDGNFLTSLRYYTEKHLPVSVLCRLQKKYAGKTVFGVTELATENDVEYFIKLQDDQNWYTVRTDADGNMRTIEKFKKAL